VYVAAATNYDAYVQFSEQETDWIATSIEIYQALTKDPSSYANQTYNEALFHTVWQYDDAGEIVPLGSDSELLYPIVYTSRPLPDIQNLNVHSIHDYNATSAASVKLGGS
jgi:hypothetical protein